MSKEYVGLVDNGKNIVKCLGCDSELFTIWDTSNEENRVDENKTIVYAKCPFCGDYTKKVDFFKGSSIGVPDSGKISHVDFGDFENNCQEFLPQKS